MRTQIIVVDDGSTDDTRQTVARFPGVAYHYQDNRGQASARNLGLRHATGAFVASLDSDDYWEPSFLEESLKCLRRHSLDFVFLNWSNANGTRNYFDQMIRDHTGGGSQAIDGNWCLLDAPQVRRIFLELCPAPSSSLVLRRSSLAGPWNEEMLIADDWCLVLDMVLNGPARAAYTLVSHWTKFMQRDNLYDGRSRLEVIERLGFHDERLLAQRFDKQLVAGERAILQRRMARYHFEYGYHQWKTRGAKNIIFKALVQAVKLSPMRTGKYVLDGVARYVWARLRPRLVRISRKLVNRVRVV